MWSEPLDCENFLTLLEDWRRFSNWADYLVVAMTNRKFDEVYWILDDIDDIQLAIWRAQDEGWKVAGITRWELMMFCCQPAWRVACRYFRSGLEVADPFEALEACNG